MKTFSAKAEEVRRDWYVVDATDKVLGRLAAEVSRRLRGKHKPAFTPHVDTGDYIVVVNVEKLRVTGAKAEDKKYYRHSTYPGGIYETNFSKLQARHPDRVLKLAVKGMLPKGRLGYAMIKKLKIYAGSAHPHEWLRRRRIGAGGRGTPRHHPGTHRIRSHPQTHPFQGGARHARRARGRAQEGWPAQGATPQAVLETLTRSSADRMIKVGVV